jgi:hypothetical protein
LALSRKRKGEKNMQKKTSRPKRTGLGSESLPLPTDTDFNSQQLDLFRTFLCNTDAGRDRLSNTFDLWNSIPRYAVSRQQMDKLRKSVGFLDLLRIEFNFRGEEMMATIQAARINDETTGTSKDYYPSANEELVEDALIKIAAEQQNAFYDAKNFRSGVVFSLYMLREELKKRGHTRSYQELILSLKILARSTIEISIASSNKKGEGFTISPFLAGLSAATRSTLQDDPEAKWIVQFHPLVTQAMDALTSRQYNYAQMMGHKNQLSRWLHKLLSTKFVFASITTTFEIRYSTIKRDSALLDSYARERKAIEVLDECFTELVNTAVLLKYEKNPLTGLRGKILDVVYTLYPTPEFVKDTKAANKRQQDSLKIINKT